jgi:Ser-Thr-rich glycosyl-phosphatidyl-inositol-anchored membrane family
MTTNPINWPTTSDYPTMGQPYTIQWDNTNEGPTVTLSLYAGCPEACVEVTDIVGGAPNTGSYTWNVQCQAVWPYLQPDETNLGYAILLIDEQGCMTQWSTNFGIHPDSIGCCGDNPPAGCNKPAVVSSAAATTAAATTLLPSSTTTALPSTIKTKKTTKATTTTGTAITKIRTAATTSTYNSAVSLTAASAASSDAITTTSVQSGLAVATAPAQAFGVVAMLAAGLML